MFIAPHPIVKIFQFVMNQSSDLPFISAGTAVSISQQLVALILQVIFMLFYILRKIKKVTANKDGIAIESASSPQ